MAFRRLRFKFAKSHKELKFHLVLRNLKVDPFEKQTSYINH